MAKRKKNAVVDALVKAGYKVAIGRKVTIHVNAEHQMTEMEKAFIKSLCDGQEFTLVLNAKTPPPPIDG